MTRVQAVGIEPRIRDDLYSRQKRSVWLSSLIPVLVELFVPCPGLSLRRLCQLQEGSNIPLLSGKRSVDTLTLRRDRQIRETE